MCVKKIPQRTCIGCNEKRDKNVLIRIVKNNRGEIFIDKTGRQDGRGVYICENIECMKKAIKDKKIEKSFKISISEEIYENLKKMINGGEIIG